MPRGIGVNGILRILAVEPQVQRHLRHVGQRPARPREVLRHVVQPRLDNICISKNRGRHVATCRLSTRRAPGSVGQAVVRNRDRHDGLGRLAAAHFDVIDGALGDERVGQALRRLVEIVARLPFDKVRARRALICASNRQNPSAGKLTVVPSGSWMAPPVLALIRSKVKDLDDSAG